jgi:hypothetical protein
MNVSTTIAGAASGLVVILFGDRIFLTSGVGPTANRFRVECLWFVVRDAGVKKSGDQNAEACVTSEGCGMTECDWEG